MRRYWQKKREAIAGRAKANQVRKAANSVMETFPEQKGQTTRDIIGKELGVSGRQVDKLHTINEKATPETKQLVREGKSPKKRNRLLYQSGGAKPVTFMI